MILLSTSLMIEVTNCRNSTYQISLYRATFVSCIATSQNVFVHRHNCRHEVLLLVLCISLVHWFCVLVR